MDCVFYKFNRCKILIDTRCSNKCKFRKTEEEFFNSQVDAEMILHEKGLRPSVKTSEDGLAIMSTEKIENES